MKKIICIENIVINMLLICILNFSYAYLARCLWYDLCTLELLLVMTLKIFNYSIVEYKFRNIFIVIDGTMMQYYYFETNTNCYKNDNSNY